MYGLSHMDLHKRDLPQTRQSGARFAQQISQQSPAHCLGQVECSRGREGAAVSCEVTLTIRRCRMWMFWA